MRAGDNHFNGSWCRPGEETAMTKRSDKWFADHEILPFRMVQQVKVVVGCADVWDEANPKAFMMPGCGVSLNKKKRKRSLSAASASSVGNNTSALLISADVTTSSTNATKFVTTKMANRW